MVACGDESGSGLGDGLPGGSGLPNLHPNNPPSNQVELAFDCELNGVVGQMRMHVEALNDHGITWGTGPNPDITGVIATGYVNYYVVGDLRSAYAYYTFRGENQFADFNDHSNQTYFDFRVRWEWQSATQLMMVVNPYGDTTYVMCALTGAGYL